MKTKNKAALGIILSSLIFGFPAFSVLSTTNPSVVHAANTSTKHIHNEGTADEIEFVPWDGGEEHNYLPEQSGNYYLTNDIILDYSWDIFEDIDLCLNGHVVKVNDIGYSVICINAECALNLYDCGDTVHNGYVDADGLWHLDEENLHILEENETAKAITGGIITGGVDVSEGGGVFVYGDAAFNMYGGTIAGCSTTGVGGGIVVCSYSTFNMYGGTITHCRALEGGGAWIEEDDLFTISGNSKIEYNTCTYDGGGVFSISEIIIGGDVQITNNLNTESNTVNNLSIMNEGSIEFGTGIEGNGIPVPTENMNIGIIFYEGGFGQFSKTGVEDYSANFFSDDGNYLVSYNNEIESSEYLELRQITIPDILPLDFPKTAETGWLNENGAICYFGSSELVFDNGTSTTTASSTIKLRFEEGNYKYIVLGPLTITFNMESGNLVSITFVGLNDTYAQYAGTYRHAHTIKDTHGKVDSTCLEAGNETYYECGCGKYFSDELLTQEITNLTAWLEEDGDGYIAPKGHNFGGEVTYTWDNDKCTASWKCQREGCTETQSELASIENGKVVYIKDTDATTESNEKGHYEATFSILDFKKQSTAANSVEIPDSKLQSKGLSGGVIAGIAVGSVVGVCLITYVAMFFVWKKNEKALKFLKPSFAWVNKKIFRK